MIKSVKMPNLGTTVDEVKVLNWFKQEGDEVKRGEPLLEVETDKATMEVESFTAGFLKKIVSKAGDMVRANEVIAYIGDRDDVYVNSSEGQETEDTASGTEIKSANKGSSPDLRISPMVKKLAEKMGVDITGIKGTGPNGLIMKDDVIRAANAKTAGGQKDDQEEEIIPFTRVGRATANAMTRSKGTIPHVYFSIDVDATLMKEARRNSDKQISYNTIIITQVAKCLKDFPYLMSKYSDNGRVIPKTVNIGIAVAKGEDLYVPVVKDIGSNSDAMAVEREVQRLIAAVNKGDIRQEDISGGVFTVSSLGAYGLNHFTAVINPPEAAILAVGAIQDRPVVIDGGIHIRPMVTLTLSVDHRLVNGAYAAGFLKALKEKLETMKG
ncbi:MAG: dihydrolipoamide acetyltransferase family protein [Mahellales bacterium]|jgi:pyruvate dehydrogenase E2 component (dihydrolipoamide acetyltransferase)